MTPDIVSLSNDMGNQNSPLHVPQQYIEPLADIFKILGDVTRLKILQALMHGELCVNDLAERLSMEQSAISHQLRILRDAHLVQNRRDGRVIFYSLADRHVLLLLETGLEHVAE